MDRLHARYPFLDGAREAVHAAGVDLEELVGSGDRLVVDRGRDRVETALSEGHVGGPHRSTRVELLSYPVARVLVSLLDEPMAVEAYARAEAATARERLTVDLPETTDSPEADGGGLAGPEAGVTLDRLLTEFDLADVVAGRDPFRVDVATYLELSRGLEGEEWALVDRPLDAGRVPVDRTELYDLLERAVADRVADGLPLAVPEAIAEGLSGPRSDVEEMLADHDVPLEFDAVVPEAFPPCMRALLERTRAGESLPAHSQYALVGFLGAAGMDADAVADLAGGELDRETIDHQLAHVRGERGVEYAPPSCATMDAYGDCVNTDERCDTINHPLAYYDGALRDREAD